MTLKQHCFAVYGGKNKLLPLFLSSFLTGRENEWKRFSFCLKKVSFFRKNLKLSQTSDSDPRRFRPTSPGRASWDRDGCITELTTKPPEASKDSAPARKIQIPLYSWRSLSPLGSLGSHEPEPCRCLASGWFCRPATRNPQLWAAGLRSARERLGVGHQTRGGARRSGCGQREQKNFGDDFSRASNPATSKPSGVGSQVIWTGEERWDLKGEEGRRPGLGNSVKRDGKPPSRGWTARWTLRAGVNPGKGRQRS